MVAAAGTLDVGGEEVSTPQTVMRRPTMTATESGAAPDSGPDAKTFRMEPPDGEQFLAWVPRLVEVSGDEDLVVTRSWDLIGIDEELQLLTGRASPRPRATDVVRPGRWADAGVILGLDRQQGFVRLAEMTLDAEPIRLRHPNHPHGGVHRHDPRPDPEHAVDRRGDAVRTHPPAHRRES